MKTIFLLLFLVISYTGFAQQISYSIVPKYACANMTHDIVISVTNNQQSIPNGISYTVNINVKDNTATTVKTFSQTYNDGFPVNTTKTYTIAAVAFGTPSTWTIDGSVVVQFVGTFPVPSQNYYVKDVPVLTITNSGNDLSVVTTPIDGYSIRYYADGNYTSIVNESTSGNYTATASASYTAKAVNYVYISSVLNTCESASPSNAIALTVTAIEGSQNSSFSVYPNPMVSTLTIKSGTSDEWIYELYDRTGLMVRTGVFKQTEEVNAADLKSGMYLLVLKNKQEKIASYKLMK